MLRKLAVVGVDTRFDSRLENFLRRHFCKPSHNSLMYFGVSVRRQREALFLRSTHGNLIVGLNTPKMQLAFRTASWMWLCWYMPESS